MSKICLITGAAKGIGKATLLRFLEDDYFCIGIDKDKQAVEQFLSECSEEKRKQIHFEILDLTHDLNDLTWSNSFWTFLHQTNLQLTLVNNIGGSVQSRKPFEERLGRIF